MPSKEATRTLTPRSNDLGLILLGLFILGSTLPSKFNTRSATKSSFLGLCWEIWLGSKCDLDEYSLYCADNMIQMQKSRIECRLDREERRVAQDDALETSRD